MTDSTKSRFLSAEKRRLLSDLLRKEGLVRHGRIPRRADPAVPPPASLAQQRLWLLQQLAPASVAYSILEGVRLRGPLDVEALGRALAEIVRRHEVLRTTFAFAGEQLVQVVSSASAVALPVEDLRGTPAERRDAAARAIAAEEFAKPFDLQTGPLLRAKLLQLDADDAVLLVNMHHIVTDGWSIAIFVAEALALYDAFCDGRSSPLPELPLQYADYAVWQRSWLEGPEWDRQLAYWKQRLEGAPPFIELPTDRPYRSKRGERGARERCELSSELTAAISGLAREHDATTFMVLMAALDVVLARWAGGDDVLVGVPVANRSRPELEPVIGFFLSTVVLRVDVAGRVTFEDLLQRVKETALEAFTHQDVPFEAVVEALRPKRSLARTPLVQVMFNMLNITAAELDHPRIRAERYDCGVASSMFDFTLYAREDAGRLHFELLYDPDLFDKGRMVELLEQIGGVLKQAVANPGIVVDELSLVTDSARALLPDASAQIARRSAAPLSDRIAAVAKRTPDAPALVDGSGVYSYAHVERSAAAVAATLTAAGVGPGEVVAVWAHRSAALVWALLGILEAGAAWLILDPSYPPARLAEYVRAARPVALVRVGAAGPALAEVAGAIPGPQVELDAVGTVSTVPAAAAGHQRSARSPDQPEDPNGLAYVTFTSGTSAIPKGILGTRGPLAHFFEWYAQTIVVGVGDRFSVLSGLAHDPLLRDLFAPLCVGAAAHFPDQDALLDPDLLGKWLARERISVTHLTPPMARLLLQAQHPEPLPALRHAFLGGDRFECEVLRRLRDLAPGARCYNAYGTTETPQILAVHDVTDACEGDEPRTLPIGRGVAGAELLVLGSGDRLAGVGEVGEICARTQQLARGYLEQTADREQRFTVNPFTGLPDDRIYRTRDLGRYDATGAVEFVGRSDQQVKIRGFRVEPAEIESELTRQPSVRTAVVLLDDDTSTGDRLIAYLVPDGPPPRPADLRAGLEPKLPAYMLPAEYVVVDSIPLTPNGKVDVAALRASRAVAGAGAGAGDEIQPPRSVTEEIVASIYRDVLGVEAIGRSDSFFDRGGHSLLAMRVMARLRDAFAVELPLRALFEAPVVSSLAELVERALQGGAPSAAPPIQPVPRDGPLMLSFGQERLWFLSQLDAESPFYNVTGAARLTGDLDVAALERGLQLLMARHEALRATFELVDGEPRQRLHPQMPLELIRVDLEGQDEPARSRSLHAEAVAEAKEPFVLWRGPLIRARLVRLAPTEHVLLVTMHHIVSDAWSVGILFRELGLLYATRNEAALPPLPLQYADYACWQRAWMADADAIGPQLAYWRERLRGAPAALELPFDRRRPPAPSFRGARVPLELAPHVVASLAAVARSQHATRFMTYAAALFALLARYTGQTDLVVGTPIANRTRSETQSLIGFFVNTLVLRVSASGDPAFAEVLDRVRVAAVGAYANQDLPFEWLVREVRPDRELGKTPLFQVMLVLQSDVDAAIEIPGLRVAPVDFDRGTSRFDLTVVLDEQGDSVSGFVEYSDDVFDRQVIDAFASAYAAILTAVAGDPGLHLSRLPLGVAEAATFAGAVTAAKPHLCVHELVAERARLHPGAIAVSHGSEEVSYADLVAKAHQLAQRLRALGVGAEDVVGIMLGRSVETVVAVLGVLFAGGAYLPLDPSAPKHRLDYMIERAAPRVIIAPDDAELPTHGASVVRRREVANPAAQPSADEAPWKPEATIHPDRAAYVMFTSGSSGVPKGVTVQHAGLANLVHALVCRLELTDADRVLQFVSPSFDVSVSEIFMALVSGATLVLARYEQLLPGPDLVELLRAQRITTVSLPASVLAALPHAQLPQLRNLIVGGETTSAATLDFWSRGRLLFHCYGPTETTVCATAAAFEEGAVATRIGHPLTNVTAYVLGSSLERLPVGAVGELYIGGVGVARGYLRRPDSTAERFLPDPFSSCPGARMYRSGDRARVLSDGSIQFLGRADDQVKIRGHRVELGDVESVLAQHPSVRQCAVVVRDGSAGDKKLVSYVLVEDTAAFGAPELRTFCRERLPEYMVPSAFIRLDTFPRTATGKVDRAALPDVDRDELAPRDAVAPRDALEEQVLAVWRTVLDVPSLGVTDNFFDVGGNSFLIIRMMTEIERVTRQRLPISAAFEHGTVAEMATVLRERLDKREVPSLVTMRRGGTKTPLFFVHPVGGNVLCYGRLVRELGRERPMFGLQARGAEGTSPPCDSIAKMATAYVDEMLAAHPRRPFALLGWSFGGGVAFEMAAVLRSRGASVGFVVLLDAAAPLAGAADAEITYHDLMPTLLHDLVGLLGAKALPSKEALQTMPEEEIERLAVDLVRGARLFVPGTEVDEVRRYVRLYRTHMNAHLRHHPTPFDGRVVYASAEASQSAGKERMIEFWRRHSGEFEVITIPGRHHDILRPPNVEQLAAQLKPLIAAVDDS